MNNMYPDLSGQQQRNFETQSSFCGTLDSRTVGWSTPNPDDLIEPVQSEIQQTFEGKTKIILSFQDLLADSHSKEAEEAKFLNIVLNIQNEKERDFYKAWETAFHDKVKGYESDHGKVDAETSTWIYQLPKVLCF